MHERASKEWAPRGACTHTRLHAVRRAYRAGAQCCHPSAVSHAGCFGCRSPRVKGPLPSPLSTCHLYGTQSVPVCLHSVNLLLSLAVGAAAVISTAFVVFGLIDAFVPNSFFLPCLDCRRAVTHKWVQPIFTRGSFPSKAKCPHCCRALMS
jgi:hypothetical protein